MSPSTKYETKRNYLLDRGLEVIWDKGYNGASVNDIVKAAGVPKGSFYNYFESKEDFAVKALDKYFRDFLSKGFFMLEDESLSPRERLYRHYEYRVNQMLTNPEFMKGCMACSMASEMSNHSEVIRMSLVNKSNWINNKMIDVFHQAQQNGEINKSLKAEEIINFIEDAFKGAVTSRKAFKDDGSLTNLLNVVKNVMLRA